MDLSDFNPEADAEAGASVHLTHPSTGLPLFGDDEKPVEFYVRGIDSPAYKEHMRKLADRRQNSRVRTLTAAEMDVEVTKSIALLVTGWSPNWTFEGSAPTFSTKQTEEILRKRTWIREQLDNFVAVRANFSQG